MEEDDETLWEREFAAAADVDNEEDSHEIPSMVEIKEFTKDLADTEYDATAINSTVMNIVSENALFHEATANTVQFTQEHSKQLSQKRDEDARIARSNIIIRRMEIVLQALCGPTWKDQIPPVIIKDQEKMFAK
jgi:hypothetical protein